MYQTIGDFIISDFFAVNVITPFKILINIRTMYVMNSPHGDTSNGPSFDYHRLDNCRGFDV